MLELTNQQKQIFNVDRFVGGSASTLCGAVFFDGVVSIDRLRVILNTLVEKDDALRIRITQGTPRQYVTEYKWQDFPVRLFETESDFDCYAKQFAKIPVDLYGQLFGFLIIQIKNRIGILIKGHHIILDASSCLLIARQIIALLKGEEFITYSFIEYASEQGDYDRSDNTAYFYKKQTERPIRRQIVKVESESYTTDRKSFMLEQKLTARLRSFAMANHVPLWATFLATFSSYIGERVSIGFPQRNRIGIKQKNTVGLFINTLPLVLDYNIDFLKSCTLACDNVLGALRHGDFDCEQLEKSLGGSVPYDVLIDYEKINDSTDGICAFWYSQGMQFESLQIHIGEYPDKIALVYDYRTEAFSAAQIEEVHKALVKTISNGIEGITIKDEQTLLKPTVSMFERFEENGKACKIIEGSRQYCFDDLRQDAEKIDAVIHGSKRVVGIICDRSYVELAAIYGIIRGGNAYLPISPDYPRERIRLILDQCDCDTVLTQKKYQGLVQGALVIEDILNRPAPRLIPSVDAKADDTLYVIFTSGSTGTPKGAMVSNASAVNRVHWMCRKYFSHDSVVMLKTPYTFDVSVWEIFAFALGGFTLYILPYEDHYRQEKVLEHIRKGSVTDLHFVPSVFRVFLEVLRKDGGDLASLRNIFLSGETLTASLTNAAPAQVHNLYGPTECAVDVTWYDCIDQEDDPIPIGRPIDNCQVLILDPELNPQPEGIVGQICIGGVPVGQGYINDRSKTQAVFISNPFGTGQLYLTGDLGYKKADGNIVFVGRADQQVKINGQRIELGEIEGVMDQFVSSAVVLVERNKLIAFYTGKEQPNLRELLRDILPQYMVPHSITHVEFFPITSSGKIDRSALIKLSRKQVSTIEVPATEEENKLLSIVKEVLSIPVVSPLDNFYDIGGDSLASVNVITRLEDCGYELSITDFLKSLSLRDAAFCMRQYGKVSVDTIPKKQAVFPLYSPEESTSAIILFPYAGGDAAAYSALVVEFRKRRTSVSLWYVPWGCDYDLVEREIRKLSIKYSISFYSHCAGVSMAMRLLDRMEDGVVRRFIAGANIPPAHPHNVWKMMNDDTLLSVLHRAGMPLLPQEQTAILIRSFRRDTEEYFSYFQSKTKRTNATVSLILSRKDLFTQSHSNAMKIWKRYVAEVRQIVYLDCASHYFQTSQVAELADYLLSEE